MKIIFFVLKKQKSTEGTSPEFGQTLLYLGGNMRLKDSTNQCKCFLDVPRRTLERELFEELGVSIIPSDDYPLYTIYTPDTEKKQKTFGYRLDFESE